MIRKVTATQRSDSSSALEQSAQAASEKTSPTTTPGKILLKKASTTQTPVRKSKKVSKKKVTKKKVKKKKITKKKIVTKKSLIGVSGKAVNQVTGSEEDEAPIRRSFRGLVVVESPAKAKTIKKYLGSGYVVKASIGHIKDLPKNKMNVDIAGGFIPHYEVIRGKSKIIKEIKDAARYADAIYLAPDPDREGEAIAWHLAEELGSRLKDKIYRISFNEITKRAVQQAVENRSALNQKKYESQQARRILDRIVGYQISPILWDKVRRGLSAGRVQSVAVRLIAEREEAIKVFVNEEYWTVDCKVSPIDSQLSEDLAERASFLARVVKENEEKFQPRNAEEAQACVEELQKHSCEVKSIQKRERRRKPQAPLITSKLQQEAASRLRFTAKRTMIVAQQLYEGVELGDEGQVALITYMRTDSTRISDDAMTRIRDYIQSSYGPMYLPEQPNIYKTKKNAQDAHEAIRPTSMDHPPERVKPYLTPEQLKLYTVIWQIFVASQMQPAIYDQTTVELLSGPYTLRTTGSNLKFPGFLLAYGQADVLGEEKSSEQISGKREDDDLTLEGRRLPPLDLKQKVYMQHIDPLQHFTQPPPRFSESSLVKELEEKGIGRPSTYATILSTIVSRAYVQKDEGRFRPTDLGILITELLVASFPQVLDVAFTAHMEEQLDDVETGQVDWLKLLGDFYYGGFEQSLTTAKDHMRDVKREEIPTGIHCHLCNNEEMVIKWGRNGSFMACKGYPKCRNTKDFIRHSDGTLEILPETMTSEICPRCQGAMVVKRGRFGQFLACHSYPECKGTKPVSIGVACPKACGGYLAELRSKRGRVFYGCSSYPNCQFACWDRPVPGACELCAHPYLIKKITKKDGVRIRCPEKSCGYQRDPELDEQDAAVLRES